MNETSEHGALYRHVERLETCLQKLEEALLREVSSAVVELSNICKGRE